MNNWQTMKGINRDTFPHSKIDFEFSTFPILRQKVIGVLIGQSFEPIRMSRCVMNSWLIDLKKVDSQIRIVFFVAKMSFI